jgi:hypothetical protein
MACAALDSQICVHSSGLRVLTVDPKYHTAERQMLLSLSTLQRSWNVPSPPPTPHFLSEKIEASRGKMAPPKSDVWFLVEPGHGQDSQTHNVSKGQRIWVGYMGGEAMTGTEPLGHLALGQVRKDEKSFTLIYAAVPTKDCWAEVPFVTSLKKHLR